MSQHNQHDLSEERLGNACIITIWLNYPHRFNFLTRPCTLQVHRAADEIKQNQHRRVTSPRWLLHLTRCTAGFTQAHEEGVWRLFMMGGGVITNSSAMSSTKTYLVGISTVYSSWVHLFWSSFHFPLDLKHFPRRLTFSPCTPTCLPVIFANFTLQRPAFGHHSRECQSPDYRATRLTSWHVRTSSYIHSD